MHAPLSSAPRCAHCPTAGLAVTPGLLPPSCRQERGLGSLTCHASRGHCVPSSWGFLSCWLGLPVLAVTMQDAGPWDLELGRPVGKAPGRGPQTVPETWLMKTRVDSGWGAAWGCPIQPRRRAGPHGWLSVFLRNKLI